MNDTIDIVKALLELDFICIDVDKRDTYIYKMLNDLVPFIENVAQLERDVKRYFYLVNQEEVTKEMIEEFSKILDKLMKVGSEE